MKISLLTDTGSAVMNNWGELLYWQGGGGSIVHSYGGSIVLTYGGKYCTDIWGKYDNEFS